MELSLYKQFIVRRFDGGKQIDSIIKLNREAFFDQIEHYE